MAALGIGENGDKLAIIWPYVNPPVYRWQDSGFTVAVASSISLGSSASGAVAEGASPLTLPGSPDGTGIPPVQEINR